MYRRDVFRKAPNATRAQCTVKSFGMRTSYLKKHTQVIWPWSGCSPARTMSPEAHLAVLSPNNQKTWCSRSCSFLSSANSPLLWWFLPGVFCLGPDMSTLPTNGKHISMFLSMKGKLIISLAHDGNLYVYHSEFMYKELSQNIDQTNWADCIDEQGKVFHLQFLLEKDGVVSFNENRTDDCQQIIPSTLGKSTDSWTSNSSSPPCWASTDSSIQKNSGPDTCLFACQSKTSLLQFN